MTPTQMAVDLRNAYEAHDRDAFERCLRRVVAALDFMPVIPSDLDPKPALLCRREGGCVCGGDTPRVRAGCSWWRG